MFNELMFALTIVTTAPHSATAMATDQTMMLASGPATAFPSCIAGPVRARLRKPDASAEIAAATTAAIGQRLSGNSDVVE